MDPINQAMAKLTETLTVLNAAPPSRAVSLAKTKIEEAQHWLLHATTEK